MLKRYAIVEKDTGKMVFTTRSQWIVATVFSSFEPGKYKIASYLVSYK
jgi:hypothetical protein